MTNENDRQSPPRSAPIVSRPYRSHKVPACDFCHRRKSRCDRLRTDEPCVLCRSYQIPCETNSTERDTGRRLAAGGKRRRTSRHSVPQPLASALADHSREHNQRRPSPPCQPFHPVPSPGASATESSAATTTTATSHRPPAAAVSNHASHIVGPALARDAQVLEKYISPAYSSVVSHARPNPYSVYSDDPRNPVVYMKVPKQRGVDPRGNGTSSFKQCETIEKILDPLGPDLFNLYFEVVHPAFPILDQWTVVNSYHQDGLPHTLVCEIYAVALISWHLSPKIRATGRRVPDVRYIWNLTVSAMHEDFLSPSFSTVLACTLDLLGRPITSITYNAVNVGSTVALANSLGLNRDPANWNLDQRQKNLRVRAWWGLLIHDHWASLSHGTPSHIQSDQWDVALPDLESLAIGSASDSGFDSDNHREGGQSFIALCQLTKILGRILPLIYSLRPQIEEARRKMLRKVETAIDDWEDQLPQFLRPGGDELHRSAPGALNLVLSFLAVKMLICRVAVQTSDPGDPGEIQYHQSRHRKAAKAVIDFVVSLTSDELWVFWLPYTAYHLTSAATLMMRCALEANDEQTAGECVSDAKRLVDYLRRVKNTENWDLAEICLGQCEAIVEQMRLSNFAGTQVRRQLPDHLRDIPRDHALTNKKTTATHQLTTAPLHSGLQTPLSRLSDINNAEAYSDSPSQVQTHVDLTMPDGEAPGYGSDLREYMIEDDFFSSLWQSTHINS